MAVQGNSGGARRFVTVRRAPEPTDMEWTSLQRSSVGRVWQHASGWALSVALLAVSVGIQLLLTWRAEEERSNRLATLRSEAEQVPTRRDRRSGPTCPSLPQTLCFSTIGAARVQLEVHVCVPSTSSCGVFTAKLQQHRHLLVQSSILCSAYSM